MPRPVKYNKPRTIKFSEIQDCTLNKLSSYKINVAQFIRDAVKEKINREHKDLLPKKKTKNHHFKQNHSWEKQLKKIKTELQNKLQVTRKTKISLK